MGTCWFSSFGRRMSKFQKGGHRSFPGPKTIGFFGFPLNQPQRGYQLRNKGPRRPYESDSLRTETLPTIFLWGGQPPMADDSEKRSSRPDGSVDLLGFRKSNNLWRILRKQTRSRQGDGGRATTPQQIKVGTKSCLSQLP